MRIHLILAIALWASVQLVAGNGEYPCDGCDKKVICYWGTWSSYRSGNGKFTVDNINPHLCTHLIYSFFGLDKTTNTIKSLDPYFDFKENWGKGTLEKVVELRKVNKKLKVMIAIGGWNEGSENYSKMAADPAARKIFIESVLAMLEKYHLDGFDVDWEYPVLRGGAPEDKQNFVLLLKELKDCFDKSPKKYILSAAVGASDYHIDSAYDVPGMMNALDFINVMTYDLHGSWDPQTGHNAPLYSPDNLSADRSISEWLRRGGSVDLVDPKKIILGLGLYGRSFTLSNPSVNGVGAPRSGPGTAGPYTREAGFLGYNEIVELSRGCKDCVQRWDSSAHVPYIVKGDQWIGFDNVQSIKEKTEYSCHKGLGGVMFWSIETDDFLGISGTTNPLIKSVWNSDCFCGGRHDDDHHDNHEGDDDGHDQHVEEVPVPIGQEEQVETVVEEVVEQPAAPETELELPSDPVPESSTPCVNGSYMPHETNPSKFWQCSNGLWHGMNCPATLVWNQDKKQCDYPPPQ